MSTREIKFEDFLKPFPESQIDWRIGQCGKNERGIWGTCLAYLQARAVMDRLDEVAGPGNWKTENYFVGAQGVVCKLSIKCDGEWVTKEDGAETTDIEAFKGGISGALKRAAVLWGIGRYLYDLEAGFIKVVEKGTPGARYGKTKDNVQFYWTPPTLPDWALPAKPPKATATPHVQGGPVPQVVSPPATPKPAPQPLRAPLAGKPVIAPKEGWSVPPEDWNPLSS